MLTEQVYDSSAKCMLQLPFWNWYETTKGQGSWFLPWSWLGILALRSSGASFPFPSSQAELVMMTCLIMQGYQGFLGPFFFIAPLPHHSRRAGPDPALLLCPPVPTSVSTLAFAHCLHGRPWDGWSLAARLPSSAVTQSQLMCCWHSHFEYISIVYFGGLLTYIRCWERTCYHQLF